MTNKFDIFEYQSGYDELSELSGYPNFEDEYGSPSELPITYVNHKGESQLYPLLEDGMMKSILMARDINDGHIVLRTNSLSSREIDGTFVSAGMVALFEINSEELRDINKIDILRTKLGPNYSVSIKDNTIKIEELKALPTINSGSSTSKLINICLSKQIVEQIAIVIGVENNPSATNLIIDALNELYPYTTRYCSNPDITFITDYLGITGPDWIYDADFWEDPNLTFPPQGLPTYDCFFNAFPRDRDGNFQYGADAIYEGIGGDVEELRELYPKCTGNTCALKVSSALNACGVNIPCIDGETWMGDDGKCYFITAAALDKWMKKVFPEDSFVCYDYSSTDNIHDEIGGATGIVISIYGPGSDASGHADLYLGNTCSINPAGASNDDGGNCAFAGEVCFWELD